MSDMPRAKSASPRPGVLSARAKVSRRRPLAVPDAGIPHPARNGRTEERGAQARAALAAALDPIITIDSRGTIQSASDSVQRVLGWTPAELVGRNVSVLMPEPHHSAHDGYLARYARTGQTNIMNRPRRFDAMRRNGTLLPIELCVTRADIPGQDAPLFVGLIRDMSAYIAAEHSREEERLQWQELLGKQTAALQTAHLQLRIADRLATIGTLAAGLGHDMNNVLLPVRARLNALRAEGERGLLSHAARKHVDDVRKSVAYLQQLADGLHFLAMDPEKENDQGETTDLASWWSQVGAMISKAAPKHVRVRGSFPRDLPDVRIAPHRLTQAVLNLVVNAGEAIPPPSERKRQQGHVRVWAEPSVTRDGRPHVRLSVTDNGRGMSEDVKRRAFDMFFTTKSRGLGTGLGLALVRKVADQSGGTVELESRVGKGTTFTMVLPVADRPDGDVGADGLVTAVISVDDGRAAAILQHVLTASGVRAARTQSPGNADLWIVEPSAGNVDVGRRWLGGGSCRRVVLFGRPPAKMERAWRALNPVTIDNPRDLDEVRLALGRAIGDRSSEEDA